MNQWGESLLAVGCIVSSLAASLLAPLIADAALPSNLPALDFGNLTSTAILGWYAWHTQTRTIPKMLDDYRAEMAAERVANDAAIARLETKIETMHKAHPA